ncbi:MAG TPA: hypothetical protein ENH10_00340, partial [Bacteroidetes bacterium]|nr:hypothetical protein [Bacteroidota bacterium]HEX03594.1 hypothetical protein [Bacteroidota bacterium]
MIAPEGLWYVLAPLLMFFGSAVLGVWRKKAWLYVAAGLFLLILVAMLFFFRNPARPMPVESAIVSVSDGVVDEIVRLPDGSTRIEVFLSLLNVHALRAPVSGVVTGYEYYPGSFIPAQHLESVEKNERITVDLMTQYGPVQMSAISGAIARRVLLPVEV